MKKIVLLFSVFSFCLVTFAQEFERPVEYLEYLSKDQKQISENLMRYISATVHSSNQAEVDRKRNRLVSTIGKVKDNVAQAPGYEEDTELKDAMLEYFTLNYQVLNDDYSRIVDMKKVAEESYDRMEAFMKAQTIAGDKVDAAQDKLDAAVVGFTSKHNIKLVQSEDQVSNMIKQANAVTDHYNEVYLIVFKTLRERTSMQQAMAAKDVEAIEKHRALTVQYADEGMQALNVVADFDGDSSLKDAAKQRLELFKEEANVLGISAVNIQLESEKMKVLGDKLQKQKPQQRKKDDVQTYNEMVDELNEATNEINANSSKYNQLGMQDLQVWIQVTELFRRKHIPKYGTDEQYS